MHEEMRGLMPEGLSTTLYETVGRLVETPSEGTWIDGNRKASRPDLVGKRGLNKEGYLPMKNRGGDGHLG
jgi:hypothetical protein